MNNYEDLYSEYSLNGGKLDSLKFKRLAQRADRIMSLKTFGRSDNPPEEMTNNINYCRLEIIDVLEISSEHPSGVSSTSNDGVSVSYSSAEDVQKESYNKIHSLCVIYLTSPVNLMYAGAD